MSNRHNPQNSRNRPGFALLISLAAIVVASALMITVLYRVQSDSAIARSGTLRRLAQVATESAVWTAVDNADVTTLRADPVGTVRTSTIVDGNATTTVTLTRIAVTFVWITADALVSRGAARARHRAGVTVSLPRDTTRVELEPLPGRAWIESF